MADFVAVIRKAVDSLPNNTPENRAKVYDKARAAIRRQLEAINPPPSDEVIARQLDKLGAAIAGGDKEPVDVRRLAELPRQSVLAPAAPQNQNVHVAPLGRRCPAF